MDIDFSRYPFDTDEHFSEFKAKLKKRLELKRTNMHHEQVVQVLPQNTLNNHVLNLDVSELETRFPLEDGRDHGHHGDKRAIKTEHAITTYDNLQDQDLVKSPEKRKDHDHRKEKQQRCFRKKAKMEGLDPPPDTPRWLRDAVEGKGGHGERLLIQKKLSDCDLNRISMPARQLRGPDDFLTEEELTTVVSRKGDKAKRFEGLDVTFVEPNSRSSVLSLRKYDYGSSSSSSSFVFAGKEWKDFVKRNGLKVGDTVQIRFFRCGNGYPYFSLVNVTAETASTSSSVVPAQESRPSSGASATT